MTSCGGLTSASGSITTELFSPEVSANYSFDSYSINLGDVWCTPSGWGCIEKVSVWGVKSCVAWGPTGWKCETLTIPLWPSSTFEIKVGDTTSVTASETYPTTEGFKPPSVKFKFAFTGNMKWTIAGETIFNIDIASTVPVLVIDVTGSTSLEYEIWSDTFDYTWEGIKTTYSLKFKVILCPTNVTNPISISIPLELKCSYSGVDYSIKYTLVVPLTLA